MCQIAVKRYSVFIPWNSIYQGNANDLDIANNGNDNSPGK